MPGPFVHFFSSAFMGVLVFWWISTTGLPSLRKDHNGSTSSTYLWRLSLPLLFSVWAHIMVDIIGHGYLPRIVEGISGMIQWMG